MIPEHYRETALCAIGSIRNGGRYNPKGRFELLYTAEEKLTALVETASVIETTAGLVGVPRSPELLLTVRCELTRVLDLADAAIRALVGVAEDELIAEYLIEEARGGVLLTPPQRVGTAAHESGRISALRVPSARRAGAVNLDIFPDRLVVGEHVAVLDETGRIRGEYLGEEAPRHAAAVLRCRRREN